MVLKSTIEQAQRTIFRRGDPGPSGFGIFRECDKLFVDQIASRWNGRLPPDALIPIGSQDKAATGSWNIRYDAHAVFWC